MNAAKITIADPSEQNRVATVTLSTEEQAAAARIRKQAAMNRPTSCRLRREFEDQMMIPINGW